MAFCFTLWANSAQKDRWGCNREAYKVHVCVAKDGIHANGHVCFEVTDHLRAVFEVESNPIFGLVKICSRCRFK